jgi:YidC/Oxa1 family membrane protein insertase
MRLYKEEKVNPLSSCLPLLVQLPFFIALFHVFQNGTKPESLSALYPFVVNPGALDPRGLFGLVDLSATHNVWLAVLAGAAQFWQGHMLVRRRPKPKVAGAQDEDFAALVNQQMTYVMPVVTVVFAWQFPAGLALYFFLTTLLLAVQQWRVFHRDGRAAGDAPHAPAAPAPAG